MPKDAPLTAEDLAGYGREYDAYRDATLQQIREGKVSASMSGIEFKMQPWDELPEPMKAQYARASRKRQVG